MERQDTILQDSDDVESFFDSILKGMLLSIIILILVTTIVAFTLQPVILANISIGGLSWLVSWVVAIIAGWIVSYIINSIIGLILFRKNSPNL